VRSDLSHRQRAGGSITTKNVNIVTNETDRADSDAMAVSAFALEFGANQTSALFVRTSSYRHVNKSYELVSTVGPSNIARITSESVLRIETIHPCDSANVSTCSSRPAGLISSLGQPRSNSSSKNDAESSFFQGSFDVFSKFSHSMPSPCRH
jgi:hypothetical protein